MSDYGARYSHLFEYLAGHGYAAAYNDHLGHGKTAAAEDLGHFGHEDGYKMVIGDFEKFYDILDEKFSDKPHFVMGHSMGSFVVRCFLTEGKARGAIIMGTGNKNPLASFAIGLAAVLGAVKGKKHPSPFLESLTFMGYNRRIEGADTKWAWLSTETQAQKHIAEDPLRNKTFTVSAFRDLYTLVKLANSPRIIEATPKDLPLVFISGSDDPLGPYGDGVEDLAKTFKNRGFKDVTAEIIPGCRHEICHEKPEIQNKAFVFIKNWLDDRIDKTEER